MAESRRDPIAFGWKYTLIFFNVVHDLKILSNDEFNRDRLSDEMQNLISILADNGSRMMAIKSLTSDFEYLKREFDTLCSDCVADV